MLHASTDDRGTVQAMSQHLDEATVQTMSRELDHAQENGKFFQNLYIIHLTLYLAACISFRLSTRSACLSFPTELYYSVLQHLQRRMPDLELHSHISLAPSPSSRPLFARADFFDYVVIRGQKYTASTWANDSSESLIAVSTSALGQTWVGELQYIFALDQDSVGHHRFGKVRWFVPFFVEKDMIWNKL